MLGSIWATNLWACRSFGCKLCLFGSGKSGLLKIRSISAVPRYSLGIFLSRTSDGAYYVLANIFRYPYEVLVHLPCRMDQWSKRCLDHFCILIHQLVHIIRIGSQRIDTEGLSPEQDVSVHDWHSKWACPNSFFINCDIHRGLGPHYSHLHADLQWNEKTPNQRAHSGSRLLILDFTIHMVSLSAIGGLLVILWIIDEMTDKEAKVEKRLVLHTMINIIMMNFLPAVMISRHPQMAVSVISKLSWIR